MLLLVVVFSSLSSFARAQFDIHVFPSVVFPLLWAACEYYHKYASLFSLVACVMSHLMPGPPACGHLALRCVRRSPLAHLGALVLWLAISESTKTFIY